MTNINGAPTVVAPAAGRPLSVVEMIAAGLVEDCKRATNLDSIAKRAFLFIGVVGLLIGAVLPSSGLTGYNAFWLTLIGWASVILAYVVQTSEDHDSFERTAFLLCLIIAGNYVFYAAKWRLLGSISNGNLVEMCLFAVGFALGGLSLRALAFHNFSLVIFGITIIYTITSFFYLGNAPFDINWLADVNYNYQMPWWVWSSDKAAWIAILCNVVIGLIVAGDEIEAVLSDSSAGSTTSVNPRVASSRWATPREKNFRKILED